MGNNEDLIYDYISAGNLSWIGPWWFVIHSVSGVDYYWDYINVG